MGKGEGWFVKKVIQSLVYCDTAQGTCSAIARTLLISSVCCWAAASGQIKLYLNIKEALTWEVDVKLGCQCNDHNRQAG